MNRNNARQDALRRRLQQREDDLNVGFFSARDRLSSEGRFNMDFDNFDKNFDKNFNRAAKGIGIFAVLTVLGSLALTAVVIWAIVMLVLHFT